MENDFRDVAADSSFSELPPDSECPLGFDIVRAPAKGSFDCVCLSEMAVGKFTHWWCGRTQPCDGPECAKCLQGSPRRWHSWVAVYTQRSSRTFILEVPPGPAKFLGDFRSKHLTLRGASLAVSRNNGKANGKVRIGVARSGIDSLLLPVCPDVVAMLERMWSSRLGDEAAAAPATLHLVAQPSDTQRRDRVS